MRIRSLIVGAAASSLLLAGCVGAPTTGTSSSPAADSSNSNAAAYSPVTISNCGFETTFTEPPKAGVSMNQGATEVMLALGLEKQMVGTAYLDDGVAKRWQEAYKTIPVLAEKYPSKEKFLEAKPDFAYASYASAFSDKNIGTRDELRSENVATYLSPFGCVEQGEDKPATMEAVWGEVTDVARIFGVEERATQLMEEQRAELEKLKQQAAGKGKTVLWYDSGDKELFAGGGTGGPQIILNTVGATNIFADVPKGWETLAWEKVVKADPDYIVFADASWSTAADKQAYLEADPVLSQLKAVKNKAYITLPFSESTPGIRLVDGAQRVAEQFAKS
jgi:ABC-type fe3+-hydroxamate transport system, periplasmic component